jgi:hypothetical protein
VHPEPTRPEVRAEVSRRGTEAAVALARSHGVEAGEPQVLNDLFSLMVHLKPAPVVARVVTWASQLRAPAVDWLRREIEVTAFLAQQGAPVVTPSTELPPGPHVHDGFAISFWTYLRADPDRTPTAAECSAMLVDLHSSLRSYPGELPAFGSTVIDLPGAVAAAQRAGDVLSPAEADLVYAAAERLAPFLADPGGRLQPIHGDAHSGNLVATRDGLVWIDFEDVCRGPVEWDLATVMDPAAVGTHHRPDPERLARCTELRALQVVWCLVALYPQFGDLEGWDGGLRGMLGMLGGPGPEQPDAQRDQGGRDQHRAEPGEPGAG